MEYNETSDQDNRASKVATSKRGYRRRKVNDHLARYIISSIAFLSLLFIGLIIVFIFREAIPLLGYTHEPEVRVAIEEQQETYGDEMVAGHILEEHQSTKKEEVTIKEDLSLGNFIGEIWQPISDEPKYGLVPLVVGSFKVSFVAVLFAAPIAILAALFTSSFAPKWAKEVMKPAIEILAGFPSVVIGFFALTVLATMIQQSLGLQYRLNAFVGGLAMSLAVIPIIYTIAEDSLTAVPRSLTEASLALGATKWQTALFVVLPAATPGVFAAVLLGIGRAFGETMIALMATGNAALVSSSFLEPVRTMTATIGAEMAEVVFGEPHYHILFLIGSLLFIFTFGLNAIAELYVRQKLMKKFRGG